MLNEQKRSKTHAASGTYLRAFLFSLLGAFTGAAVCVTADYFVGNISGILYIFTGMTAYAFYVYFVRREDQKNIHILLVAASCLIAVTAAVFAECAVNYAGSIQDPDMNIIQKTFELYRLNITENGFSNYKYMSQSSDQPVYSLSILLSNITCAVMSFIGLGLSWLFVRFAGDSWEKKHGRQDYSYSGRAHRSNNKKRKRRH